MRAPEQRTIDVDVGDLDTRGRTLHGYASVYGVESDDLGGFRERIAPGAFGSVLDADVRCLLNHDPSQVLGRTRSGTLRLRDEERGLKFECELPASPLGDNVREAVKRGDLDGASFRFVVGDEEWDGEVRTVKSVRELHDVTVATYGAYPAASVELRTRPERNDPPAQGGKESDMENRENGGGLAVEDRQASAGPNIEQRITDAVRSVRRGESRALTTTSAEPIAPPELATFLWDRLRDPSIALASGIRVIPTTRESITWPRLISDVDPTWVAELETIPEGPPGFGTLEAKPRKLAHRIADISNEVIDDSEPSIIDVLNGHMATMLALKLDRSIFEGNPASNANSIRGLKYVSGIQTIAHGGANGAPLENYDPFVRAVGSLRSANVPGPYAIAMHPNRQTDLELLKESADSNVALEPPSGLPGIRTTSQLAANESQGTSSNSSSAYVYAPGQIVLVRRADAEIELDRSVGFDNDSSAMRAKLRADLMVPNPVAVVRVTGLVPPA